MDAAERSRRSTLDLIWIGNLVLLVIARFVGPFLLQTMPMCIFRWLTGHYCPFCGMTRAYMALSHGRIAEGWQQTPMAVVFVASGFVIGIARVVELLEPAAVVPVRVWHYLAYAVGIALLVNWVYLFITH
jgi:hypothetical protein